MQLQLGFIHNVALGAGGEGGGGAQNSEGKVSLHCTFKIGTTILSAPLPHMIKAKSVRLQLHAIEKQIID